MFLRNTITVIGNKSTKLCWFRTNFNYTWKVYLVWTVEH